MHIMRGEGDGMTVYFGEHRGSPFVSVDLRGFNGWTSRPAWMPGGWEFFEPTLRTGRLYVGCRTRWSMRLLLPAGLVSFYRWRISPHGRRYIRDHGRDLPTLAR